MRIRRTFTVVLLLGLICAQIQASEKEVESKISDVVVFLNGAQITRTAEAQIPAGETQIIFKGLTSELSSNSLQVSSSQDIAILSVNHSQDYMVSPKVNEQISRLRKQRNELRDSITLAKNKHQVRAKEKEMLLNNQSVGGSETGYKVEELRVAMDFFRNRMTEIEQKLFELNKQITPMEERLKKLNKQLEELNAQKDRPTSSVIVEASSERAINTSFQIIYTVKSPYWQPFYDLRVKNIEEPLTLNYKAKISQNTGIDWDDVNLSLSTGNPSLNQEKPDLDPWIIRPIRPLTREITDTNKPKRMATGATLQMTEEEAPKAPPRISPEKQQTTTIFHINQPLSIQSGGKEHDVAIMEHEIDAEYQYATVPKRSPHAYLMARMTDWNDLDILPGDAAIYFNQTFKGNTFIDPYIAEDTLSLSIGRDPGIVVEREVQKDYSSNTFFGNNQKETKAWKITVRNNKNTAVEIVVEDQMPISGDSDIKVELEERSGARVNRKTGLLKWPLSLEPGETRELNFVYSVQYPKDTRVILE